MISNNNLSEFILESDIRSFWIFVNDFINMKFFVCHSFSSSDARSTMTHDSLTISISTSSAFIEAFIGIIMVLKLNSMHAKNLDKRGRNRSINYRYNHRNFRTNYSIAKSIFFEHCMNFYSGYPILFESKTTVCCYGSVSDGDNVKQFKTSPSNIRRILILVNVLIFYKIDFMAAKFGTLWRHEP